MTDGRVYSCSRPIVADSVENAAPQGASLDPTHTEPALTSGSVPPSLSAACAVTPEPVTIQASGSRPPAELLAIADLMEGWAAVLPRWDSEVTEPWFVFLERAYKAETSLAEKLRQLPTCLLSMCPLRMQVSLKLAGISVSTKHGLAAACRAWAQKARAGGCS